MSQYTTSIQQLYVAFFQRPADVAGLAYWEDALQKNQGDLSPVISAFVQSAETQATYAGQTNKEAVGTIYRNLFGHPADGDGLRFWTQKLDNFEVTLGDIIKAISAAASDYDRQIFTGKVNVALSFTAALDTPEKANAYANAQGGNLAKEFLGGITSITSAAMALARADSLVANVLQAPLESRKVGHSFNLTAGPDVFVGNGERDQFSALGTVLATQDRLDGGANQDSLTIIGDSDDTFSPPLGSQISNIETINVIAVNVAVDSSACQGVQKLNVAPNGDASVRAAAATNIVLESSNIASRVTIDGGHDVSVAQSISRASVLTIGAQSAPTGVVDIQLSEDIEAELDAPIETSAAKLEVHGGVLVNIKQVDSDGLDNVQAADIRVFGTALTKAVYIDQAPTLGHVDGAAIVINDSHANSNLLGSVQTVDVTGNTDVTINDNALSNLRIANSAGKVVINNAPNLPNTSLNLALDNAQISLADAGIYQTLNLNVNGEENRFTHLQMASVETLNLSGYGFFALQASDLPGLKTITLASGANLTAQDLTQSAQLTLVDASSGWGRNQLTLDAQRTVFKASSGADNITLSGRRIDMPVNLGAGDDLVLIDTALALPKAVLDGGSGFNTVGLHVQDASNLSKSSDFAAMTHHFQVLMLDQLRPFLSVDVGKLGNFEVVKILGSEAPYITSLNNMNVNTALHLAANSEATVIVNNPAFASGSNDTVRLQLGTAESFSYTAGTVSLQNVEGIKIEKAPAIDVGESNIYSITIQDDALTTLASELPVQVNLQDNAIGKVKLDLKIPDGSVTWACAAASEIDVVVDTWALFNFTRAQKNAKISISGESALQLTIDQPVSLFLSNSVAPDDRQQIVFSADIRQVHANSSVGEMTTLAVEHTPFLLTFAKWGHASFNPQQVQLNSNADLQNYADAVIAKAGNAANDAAGGWFQLGGDTYYVQSHHDATSKPGFVGGSDFIIKLTGLHDLSSAAMEPLSANSLIILH